MNFGEALVLLKVGHSILRKGWNGKDMYIHIRDDKGARNGIDSQSYIEIKTADNKLIPWVASQTDILADDWQIFC